MSEGKLRHRSRRVSGNFRRPVRPSDVRRRRVSASQTERKAPTFPPLQKKTIPSETTTKTHISNEDDVDRADTDLADHREYVKAILQKNETRESSYEREALRDGLRRDKAPSAGYITKTLLRLHAYAWAQRGSRGRTVISRWKAAELPRRMAEVLTGGPPQSLATRIAD